MPLINEPHIPDPDGFYAAWLLANSCDDQATLLACIAEAREQKPQVRELAPGVYGYISDFDPNCGFMVGDEHVVLINTRPTPRMARDFLAAIRTVTDKPIRFIVLTHYHAVRVMGASAFPEVPGCGGCFSGDVVENHCSVYAGDAYIRDWAGTLDAVKTLRPRVLVPGCGAVPQDEAACAEAIDLTKDFLSTLLGAVRAGIDAGDTLKGCFARAEAAMTPRFGQWPVFQHVLPFDVWRAYDELTGTEHPVVWTAERDRALWQVLRG